MRIAIDVQGAQGGSAERGIGRYVREFISALIRASASDPSIDWILLASPNAPVPPKLADVITASDKVKPEWIALPHEPRRGHYGMPIDSSGWDKVSPGDVDVLVVPSPFEGYRTSMTIAPACRPAWSKAIVTVVYDLIPLRHSLLYLDPDPHFYRWYRQQLQLLRESDAVLCVSQATADDVLAFLDFKPDRVHTIGAAPPMELLTVKPASTASNGDRQAGNPRKLLYVYHQDYRKRADILVDATAALISQNEDISLHIVTNEEEVSRILGYANMKGIPASQIFIQSNLSDAELANAYSSAWFTVIPSIDEGFGLPAVESIVRGTPVLASNAAGIPEAVGTRDALFEPGNTRELVHLLSRAIRDPKWRRNLYERQFTHVASLSWESVGERSFSVVSGLAASSVRARLPERPKLTLSVPRVNLYDPAFGGDGKSGLTGYLKELVCLLDARFDLRVKAPGWQLGGVIGELAAGPAVERQNHDGCHLHQVYLSPEQIHEQLTEMLERDSVHAIELHGPDIDATRLSCEISTAVANEQATLGAMGEQINRIRTDLLTAITASETVIAHDASLARIVERSAARTRGQEVISLPYPSFVGSNEAKPPNPDRSILLIEFGHKPELGQLITRLAVQAGLNPEGVLRFLLSSQPIAVQATIRGMKIWTRPMPPVETILPIARQTIAAVFVNDGNSTGTIDKMLNLCACPATVLEPDNTPVTVRDYLVELFRKVRNHNPIDMRPVEGPGQQQDTQADNRNSDSVRTNWLPLLHVYDEFVRNTSAMKPAPR